jgi:hypothetical protein
VSDRLTIFPLSVLHDRRLKKRGGAHEEDTGVNRGRPRLKSNKNNQFL